MRHRQSESKQEVVVNDRLEQPTNILNLPVNSDDLSKVNPVLRNLSLKGVLKSNMHHAPVGYQLVKLLHIR